MPKPIVVKAFDHAQVCVGNLEESIDFYEKVFGFNVREVGLRGKIRWAVVANEHNLSLCLHEYPDARGKQNTGLTINHIGFILDDFDGVIERLKAFDVPLVYQDYIQYHSSRSVYFTDPNGYKLEISEHAAGGNTPPRLATT